MNIGVVCYASIGGSGIIATELGKALAARGHQVHILSSEMPARLGDYQAVQGGLLLIALTVMLVNLAVDVLYGFINPRIRHVR